MWGSLPVCRLRPEKEKPWGRFGAAVSVHGAPITRHGAALPGAVAPGDERGCKMRKTEKKGMRTVIVVLSILLALSVAALCGVLIWQKLSSGHASVEVPDNAVTWNQTGADADTPDRDGLPDTTGGTDASRQPSGGQTAQSGESVSGGGNSTTDYSVLLELYKRHASENAAFDATGMLPGDRVEQDYRLRLFANYSVTVHFTAKIQDNPAYQKLAEVLKMRVSADGQLLYEGLMRDIPASLDYKAPMPSRAQITGGMDILYHIEVYLDGREVGNEYMNKVLKADFLWWVDDSRDPNPLDPDQKPDADHLVSPRTGDTAQPVLWLSLTSGSLALLLVLAVRKKRQQEREG